MLFKTRSASVYGIEAYLVDVEVNLSSGGTNGEFFIVGLPDTAVRESRSRVLAAIRNNGFGSPFQRIIVNLAPADMKKEGSAFDLPMAIGILGSYGMLAKADLSDASAAWYDQYIVSLSATGAAYQTLVVEGVLTNASLSSLSGAVSDLYSLLSDHHSDFQSRVPKRVATDSQLSDLHSDLRSFLVVMSGVVCESGMQAKP